MRWLLNPTAFNYVIMCLYLVNATNYSVRREYWQASYWMGAFWITLSVTFGFKH